MPLTTATLDDIELLADEPVTWPNLPGVFPAQQEFSVTPGDADKLMEKRGPFSLKITPGGDGQPLVIKNLWCLAQKPAKSPFLARVLVSDRRWFWPSRVIIRDFNVRRRTGYYRTKAAGIPELERVEEKFAYAKYSVRDYGVPWTAPAAVVDILEELAAWESFQESKQPFTITTGAFPAGVTFENQTVGTDGASAVGQILRFMPGIDIRLTHEGNVVLFDRAAGGENAVQAAIGPEIVGGGHVIAKSHRNESPRAIDVFFQIEAEVRFDLIERAAGDQTTSADLDPDEELRQLHPVLPLPDYQLSVGGFDEVQGTIVGFPEYIEALPALPAGGRMTDVMIRQAFMPFMDLWSSILAVGILDTDSDWAARVSAIQQYYRRMVRIPRGWHDRVLGWRAYRVGTVNQATGSRAPSVVYADHCILGGQRSQLRDYSRGQSLKYAINVDGYRETLDASARPAPFEVEIYDNDQGVVLWNPKLDPYRVYEQVLPSKIEQANNPGLIGGAARYENRVPISFDTIKSPGAGSPSLSANHQAAMIVTGVLAAPNGQGRLYRIRVTPADMDGWLNPTAIAAAKLARGPVKQVFVSPGLETARISWQDERSEDIERLFGLREGVPILDGLCVNAESQSDAVVPGFSASSGASLDKISKAVAARIWASFADHLEGTVTGKMTDTPIDGWTSSLVHTLHSDGTAVTMATFPDRLPELELATFLDPATRAIIQRQVFKS